MSCPAKADSTNVELSRLPDPLPLHLARQERRIQLGALLVRDGLLDAVQLEQALLEKEKTARRLGEIVVERGWISGRG